MSALPIGLALGGSVLSSLFGGGKDPGPSNVLQNSRADALRQSARYLDAFFGSNWRGGWAGDSGEQDVIDHGDSSKFSKFRWGQTSATNPDGTFAKGASEGGSTGSLWGGTTPFGNAPILQQIYGATNAGLGENARTLNDYNQGAEAGYREATRFGTGQKAVIESDAAKSLKDANALTMARLNGMGLGGSTIATDAMGANAAGNLRELSRAKANLADQATGLRLQQRNQATAGRAALQQSLNASNQNLRMTPIQAQLNTMGSGIVAMKAL